MQGMHVLFGQRNMANETNYSASVNELFCDLKSLSDAETPSFPTECQKYKTEDNELKKSVWNVPSRSISFLGSSDSKESTCNAGDLDSVPGTGRPPEEGNGNPLQFSYLENPMYPGSWQTTFLGVVKSQIWLSD